MTPPGSPQHILMTADAVGGVWTYALELCRGLGEAGVHVTLATMGPAPSPQQRVAVRPLRNVTLRESTYRLEWMDAPWDDVARAGDWLLALEREVAPDLVHLNGYAHAALPWRAPRLVVGHSCVLSWWRGVHGTDAPASWDAYREAVTRGLHAADLVIAPTAAMLNALRFHYGVDDGLVIANGRDAAEFRAAPRKDDRVLCVGRLWDEAKNVRALVDIAPEHPWRVCVAGDTTAPDGTTQEFPGVERLGRCSPEQLAGHFARAAIYALPARYEPFGLSVLEAALAECALVLGDIPSLREVWHDAAVFVAPDDRAGLHRAIDDLIRNPAQRQEFAVRARRRAAQYSSARMCDHYLAAYRGLFAAQPASALLA
jgi:glycosyltransferase involved in cell wall biosynthesis